MGSKSSHTTSSEKSTEDITVSGDICKCTKFYGLTTSEHRHLHHKDESYPLSIYTGAEYRKDFEILCYLNELRNKEKRNRRREGEHTSGYTTVGDD